MAHQFRLKSVLRVRRIQEDIAKLRLAESNRALIEASTDRDRRVAHYGELGTPVGECSYDEFVREAQVMKLAAESVGLGNQRVVYATEYTGQRRSEFLSAHQKVEALVRLETRQRAEFRLAENRREVSMVDDIVTTRWARDMALSNSALGNGSES